MFEGILLWLFYECKKLKKTENNHTEYKQSTLENYVSTGSKMMLNIQLLDENER